MKFADIFFIVFVAAILFGLTTIRYRKQITGMIRVARLLKDAKGSTGLGTPIRSNEKGSVQLVNCAKCGVWVPQNKAIKQRNGFYCSNCQ